MAKQTIKQLEATIKEQEKLLARATKLINKAQTNQSSVELRVSETEWQTLEGTFKNQVSLAPFKEGGKYPTPSIYAKFSQPTTKAGFDKMRAIIDVAEHKLDEAGILTA